MITGAVCPNCHAWFEAEGNRAVCPSCGFVHVARKRRRIRLWPPATLSFFLGLVFGFLGFRNNDALFLMLGGALIIPGELGFLYLMVLRGARTSPSMNPGFDYSRAPAPATETPEPVPAQAIRPGLLAVLDLIVKLVIAIAFEEF